MGRSVSAKKAQKKKGLQVLPPDEMGKKKKASAQEQADKARHRKRKSSRSFKQEKEKATVSEKRKRRRTTAKEESHLKRQTKGKRGTKAAYRAQAGRNKEGPSSY